MIRCLVFNRLNRSFDASHIPYAQFCSELRENRFTSHIIIAILSHHTSIVAANYKLNEIEMGNKCKRSETIMYPIEFTIQKGFADVHSIKMKMFRKKEKREKKINTRKPKQK